MDKTSAKIWRGDPAGFVEAMEEVSKLFMLADVTQDAKKWVEALVQTASIYYSFARLGRGVGLGQAWRNFGLAKHYAASAYAAAQAQGVELTHGQHDVLGTIMLRSWLWLRGDPKIAAKLFADGLALKDIPPHSRALMLVGIAEAYSRLEGAYNMQINVALRDALALKKDVLAETDRKLATKQYFRVLMRVMMFEYLRGNVEHAAELYIMAKAFAHHDENHVESVQLERLEKIWHWRTCLWWLRALLPH